MQMLPPDYSGSFCIKILNTHLYFKKPKELYCRTYALATMRTGSTISGAIDLAYAFGS